VAVVLSRGRVAVGIFYREGVGKMNFLISFIISKMEDPDDEVDSFSLARTKRWAQENQRRMALPPNDPDHLNADDACFTK
jgi:hypothetical protein